MFMEKLLDRYYMEKLEKFICFFMERNAYTYSKKFNNTITFWLLSWVIVIQTDFCYCDYCNYETGETNSGTITLRVIIIKRHYDYYNNNAEKRNI